MARNAQREADEARGKLVLELLPVLDDLDRTIQAGAAHGGDTALLEGVRMVRAQLDAVLERYGVERIDAIGQTFDPARHEALGVTPVAEQRSHNVVTTQVQPGYQFAGKLLRPAKVLVGKLARPAYPPRTYWG